MQSDSQFALSRALMPLGYNKQLDVIMRAKYSGKCGYCHNQILKGEWFVWRPKYRYGRHHFCHSNEE